MNKLINKNIYALNGHTDFLVFVIEMLRCIRNRHNDFEIDMIIIT